jgi:hypothetical protein
VGLNRVDAAQRPAQRSVEFPVPSRAIPGTANLRRLHDLSLRSPRRPCATRSNSVIPFLLFTTERVGLCLPFSAALFPWRFCSQTSTWLIPSTTKPKNLTSTSWLRRKPLLTALPPFPSETMLGTNWCRHSMFAHSTLPQRSWHSVPVHARLRRPRSCMRTMRTVRDLALPLYDV